MPKFKLLKLLASFVIILVIWNAIAFTSFVNSKTIYKGENFVFSTLIVNDKKIDLPDAKPFMDSNFKTFIPVRVVSEALGAKVFWNGNTKQVTLQKDSNVLILTIGKAEYTHNNKLYKLESAIIAKDNRTFAPIDMICDFFGADILMDLEIETMSIIIFDKSGYTTDCLEIYSFDGKEYVSTRDVEKKFKCMITTDTYNEEIKIYGQESVAAWDLDYTEPLIKTKTYISKNSYDFFEVKYYEDNIKPILSQPRETFKPSYTENGLNIYVYNGIAYVLPGDVGRLFYDYMFTDVSDKVFNFVKVKDVFCTDYEVIVSGVPATVVNGRLSIEYEYYKKNILPKIEK